jgi:biotin operon repressor
LARKKEDPSFFAIIPATVRYDKSLNPYARLLYGELTALSKKEGYAWASNKYLADLYQVDRSSISHWIKQLQDKGYIKIELIYDQKHNYIEERRIYLTDFEVKKACKKGIPVPDPQGVVTDITGGGDKAPKRSLQAINTSSSSDPPGIEKTPSGEEEEFENADNYAENCALENSSEGSVPQADPLPDVSMEKAFDALSLKRLLRDLNPSFVFSEPFYQRALDFLASSGLDSGYASWLCEFCVKQKPNSIANYFYKVFFDARCAELYLEESKPPPVNIFKCPACSTDHDPGLSCCPACGLAFSFRKDQKEIFRRKKLFEMPPGIKAAYCEEFDNMRESAKSLGFREKNALLNSLDQKYGLALAEGLNCSREKNEKNAETLKA